MSEQTKEQSVWHDKDDTLESKVYQAIGAGSMCWSETPKGVFDSDNAKKYGDALWKAIEAERSALLKTMEGEPVAWMEPASKFTMNADMKKALSSGHIKETCEADRFSIPLYASTHTKTITVDEILELVKENDMDAEGDESFTNESHWANLHNRLTSKFK